MNANPIRNVIVLGGGSAGFLAALALKVKLPGLAVTVIRSRDIGIIGVGEGSTVGLTAFLHDYLGVNPKKFFAVAQPTWKLGLRFLWGRRPYFNYNFVDTQLTGRAEGLNLPKGFYAAAGEMGYEDPVSALMSEGRAFDRLPAGGPRLHKQVAYHFENEKFVAFLEGYAAAVGVKIVDDTVVEVRQDEGGISELRLAGGTAASADLYVDCSGFRSELLGRALGEPFVSYAGSLFCDRAVVGGWERTDEPILPYTTCETMPNGWCWRIEHETRVNRGYVYSGAAVTDERAEAEFRAANPKVGPTRVVKFVSGRRQRAWVKNVVAVGNACGFVEPLEATALGLVGIQSVVLCDSLLASGRRLLPTQRDQYNRHIGRFWDHIRDFLAVHYRFNDRLDTPFWQRCRAEVDLAGAAEVVDVYREHGPSPFWEPTLLDSADQFRLGGYFNLLLGQRVPHGGSFAPDEAERKRWEALCAKNRQQATRGLTVKESLAAVRSPKWQWPMA